MEILINAVVDGETIKLNQDLQKVVSDIVNKYVKHKLSDGWIKTVSKIGRPKKDPNAPKRVPYQHYSEEDYSRIIEKVKMYEPQGLTDGAISKLLVEEFKRTSVALNLVIYRLRIEGRLSRTNPNH